MFVVIAIQKAKTFLLRFGMAVRTRSRAHVALLLYDAKSMSTVHITTSTDKL